MKYRAILFDLDGTLLPMDMEVFTKGYFKLLAAKLAKYKLEPQKLMEAVWSGTAAMVKNDGKASNEARFWEAFEKITNLPREEVNAECLEFYDNEFNQAKIFTGENPRAKWAVKIARQKAPMVVLATNPLFPLAGQNTRLGWLGLSKEDFDLVTSYEQDCYCKPNPKYFETICARIGVKPEECLMIGNDEGEDIAAASSIGMDCYLVTDCLVKKEGFLWQGQRGTFEEMIQMLEALKEVTGDAAFN